MLVKPLRRVRRFITLLLPTNGMLPTGLLLQLIASDYPASDQPHSEQSISNRLLPVNAIPINSGPGQSAPNKKAADLPPSG